MTSLLLGLVLCGQAPPAPQLAPKSISKPAPKSKRVPLTEEQKEELREEQQRRAIVEIEKETQREFNASMGESPPEFEDEQPPPYKKKLSRARRIHAAKHPVAQVAAQQPVAQQVVVVKQPVAQQVKPEVTPPLCRLYVQSGSGIIIYDARTLKPVTALIEIKGPYVKKDKK